MTTRRWAVAVGMIALVLVPIRWACNLGQQLADVYDPDGKIRGPNLLSAALADARGRLERREFVAAETRYREAAVICDHLREIHERWGWVGLDAEPQVAEIAAGLRAARLDQGRSPEGTARPTTP